jgi:hypothetical protein
VKIDNNVLGGWKMESVLINGEVYEKKEATVEFPWVVIRSRDAGVFFGQLVKDGGSRVDLINSRRIYYWDGAATLSQLSQEGVKSVTNCKFPCVVPMQSVLGVCEIIIATDAARESIQSVPIWKR